MPLGRVEEGPRGTDRVDGEKLLEKHNGFAPLGLIVCFLGKCSDSFGGWWWLVLDFEQNLGGWWCLMLDSCIYSMCQSGTSLGWKLATRIYDQQKMITIPKRIDFLTFEQNSNHLCFFKIQFAVIIFNQHMRTICLVSMLRFIWSTRPYFFVPVLLKVALNQRRCGSAMAAGIPREFSVKLPKDRCVLVHLGTSLASWSWMWWKGMEVAGENERGGWMKFIW